MLVSPHFPPDSSAGTHRVRLLAPALRAHGWEPTVVTVDPRDLAGRPDGALARLVPADLRVIRCRALPLAATRRLGVGDLGLRALPGLRRALGELCARERPDALFVTMYPTWPALLGPALKRRFGVRFVLDYQDPWVGAWGRSVGGGAGGRPDLKSRLTRWMGARLEPRTARAADGITAVSQGTWAAVVARNPALADRPFLELPIGFDPADLAHVDARPAPGDGLVHVCYVGTLLPLGVETLRAVLAAVARLRAVNPALGARLRLHFYGTSNERTHAPAPRVLPHAAELGVADLVSEHPARIDYLDALAVLRGAGAILLMGSSERHYTASKLYPALWAERPLLAVYHAASTVVDVLSRCLRPPSARLVTYDDHTPPAARVAELTEALAALVAAPRFDGADVDAHARAQVAAPEIAGRLARFLDEVVA